MIHFAQELEFILQDDPLNLLTVKSKRSSVVSADERLVASFEEINAFVQEHGHEPAKSRVVSERNLYSRLKGLRENPAKALVLKEYDRFNLLGDVVVPEPIVIETVDDILAHDVLGLLDGDEADIFQLKHVSKPQEMPSYVARRKPCAEFEQFEPLFKQVHADLASGKKVMRPFQGERQIKKGEFFLDQGMLVYVANQGEWEKRGFGNYNARLWCIFENGTESHMLLRSLAAALWKNQHTRTIVDAEQAEQMDLMDQHHEAAEDHNLTASENEQQITEGDKATGYIYVLRSLSNDPQIKKLGNLHKIGFSRRPVPERIDNAVEDPTYLMADVLPITYFEVYNVNPQRVENLLHRFFTDACLDLTVTNKYGRPHQPREWFIVPQQIIEETVRLLENGDIIYYKYDTESEKIMKR